MKRWSANVNEAPVWDERNGIIASHILPTDVIWDFGAGNQTIRSRKPPESLYIPIDCVAKTPDTIICDFNQGFTLPGGPSPTLLVMSGFLEYVTDPESFFQSLSRSVKGTRTVFSWAHLPAEREARLRHGWISPLVVDPTNPAFFLRHFEGLRRVAVWNGQGVYEGLLA